MSNLIPINPQQKLKAGSIPYPFAFEMGDVLGQKIPFDLHEEQLSQHSFVLGAPGSGKSKFIELLMRHLMYSGRGFALLDPHGDLAEDMLAYAGSLKLRGIDLNIANRIHYIEPSVERMFSFDPFIFRPSKPVPKEFEQNAYSAWLRAKADRVAEIFQRKQNQTNFEGMPRLQRVLTDVLVAVGAKVNEDSNEHLSLSDAMLLLDFSDPERHRQVYQRIRPYLEPEIAADFDRLATYRNEEQRLRETESTINRLRSLFSPLVKSIFSQTTESLDIRSIIQRGEILIINLQETDYFSADQQRALGGMFIHEILSITRNEPRRNRKPFHFFIDESTDFIADDIVAALKQHRKFLLSICLVAQELSSFKKGENDYRDKVLTACGTKVCFKECVPADLEILARVLATGNLNFDKHEQEVDRPDGYDWIDVEETSEGEAEGATFTHGTSSNHSDTKGTSSGVHSSESHGTSDSQNRSRGLQHGDSVSRNEHLDTTRTASRGDSSAEGATKSNSNSRSDGHSEGKSESKTVGGGTSDSMGKSIQKSKNKSKKKIPLARHRTEIVESSSLETSISDQVDFIKQTIQTFRRGEAMANILDVPRAVVFKTEFVHEHWEKDEKFAAIERMKELCTNKPYFSIPDFSVQASKERVDKFIDGPPKIVEPAEETKTEDVPFVT